MKIALTAIHYPVTMVRYFWEALLRREDVELWVAGPFSGNWIPWLNGMTLPERYVREPDLKLPIKMGPVINYGMVERACPFTPDLWLEINAGIQATGRPSGKYAVVATDPHVLTYDRTQPDFFFSMQTPYMQEGDIWLPYGYDPVWHTPGKKTWEERQYDCALVGLIYENRKDFFIHIRAKGAQAFAANGPAYEDAREIYHDARTGFNWSSMQDTTARVFELMALQVTPILNRVPDLQSLFREDEHYLGFSTLREAVEKFDWALTHPEDAQEIAKNARKAVEPHSWDARVDKILDVCLG